MSYGNWLSIVIPIIVAFWIYYRTRDHRIVRYAQVRRDLMSEEAFSTPPDRLITVDGEPIRRLYREYILIHSSGNKSIRFAEELNSISLNLPQGERVLAAGIYRNDDPANAAIAEFDSNQVDLRFEYLRSKDSIVFFVDHEVTEESSTQVSLNERERDAVKRGNHTTMQVIGDRQTFAYALFLVTALLFPIVFFATDLHKLFFSPEGPPGIGEAILFMTSLVATPSLGFIFGLLLHRLFFRQHTPAMRAYLVQVIRASAARTWLTDKP